VGRHAAAPDHAGGVEAARARIRQANGLLPALNASCWRGSARYWSSRLARGVALSWAVGDGSQWGLVSRSRSSPRPAASRRRSSIGEKFIGGDAVSLVLGDNIFYAQGLAKTLQAVATRKRGATVFGYRVREPSDTASWSWTTPAARSPSRRSRRTRDRTTRTVWYVLRQPCGGDREVASSGRLGGELEITDVNRRYLEWGRAHGRGPRGEPRGLAPAARVAAPGGELCPGRRAAPGFEDRLPRGGCLADGFHRRRGLCAGSRSRSRSRATGSTSSSCSPNGEVQGEPPAARCRDGRYVPKLKEMQMTTRSS